MSKLKLFFQTTILTIFGVFMVAGVVLAITRVQVPQGGTGAGTWATGSALIGSSTNAIATTTYAFPLADGTSSQVLTTDGSGQLSWANQSAAGTGDPFAWTVAEYGVSTSTTLGFESGFLSLASSTFTNTVDFGGAVTGIALNEIEDLTTDKTFTMAANNLTYNFTTPSDGFSLNASGAFSDHILHIHQFTGNPGAGTALIHLQNDDTDVRPIFITTASAVAIDMNGDLQISSSEFYLGDGSATSTLSSTGGTLTINNNIDLGGASSLEIPNSGSPTVGVAGRIALDTTDNQLLVADSGGTARVIPLEPVLFAVTIASTSADWFNGGMIDIPSHTKDGRELTQFRCHVDGGTSVVANVTDDGTNDTESITCATTQTSDTNVATNDTFTADELWGLEMGAITGAVDYLVFEAYGYITRE